MPTTDAEPRFELIEDDEPVDPGDWLPVDAEHYAAVGPFTLYGRELTAAEWFARPESDVTNYASFGLVLVRTCDLGHSHRDYSAAVWGNDFLGYPYCRDEGHECPQPGTYTLADLTLVDAATGGDFLGTARDILADQGGDR